MAVNITSNYSGEVLDRLLVRATTGNELVDGGHIRLQPNVQKSFNIPRLKTGRMLQKRKEQPVEADAKGAFDIDEKVLTPVDFMAFTTFNPRSFEHIWRPFQPTGNLVFRELDPTVQNQLLTELSKTVQFELGYHFINGVFGSTDNELFYGILTRIVADSDIIRIASPTAIVDANILEVLRSVRAKLPKPLQGSMLKKNVKFFMSVEDAQIYDYVLTEKPFKGVDYTNMNPERYKGFQIVPLADWPKDVIVAAYATANEDSNFWAAVDYINDTDVIQIDKLTNAGEKYFFKMLMKADTNIVWGEDIVLYDGRGAAAPEGFAATSLSDPDSENARDTTLSLFARAFIEAYPGSESDLDQFISKAKEKSASEAEFDDEDQVTIKDIKKTSKSLVKKETELNAKTLEIEKKELELKAEQERLVALAKELEAKEVALLDLEDESKSLDPNEGGDSNTQKAE